MEWILVVQVAAKRHELLHNLAWQADTRKILVFIARKQVTAQLSRIFSFASFEVLEMASRKSSVYDLELGV